MIKICDICHKYYSGWGNNAEPVLIGECCDECNSGVVLPKRYEEYLKCINSESKK